MVGNVCRHVNHFAARGSQTLNHIGNRFRGAHSAQNQIPAFTRQSFCDAQADPSGAAGD
jgi:hypothetical protein